MEKIAGLTISEHNNSKRIVNIERKRVKYNSCLTELNALMKSFKDLLPLPSLKILVKRNNRRILKNRPSRSTNCFR